MADDYSAKSDSAKERIKLVRDCYKRAAEYEQPLRKEFEESIKFIHKPGEQWDTYTKTVRGQDRPMYQFNRSKVTVARIVNDMRANRPQGKVRGQEDGDKDTAEIYEGLCRNIANVSNFESITDDAAQYQVAGGYWAWRVDAEYSDDDAFDQDIKINPLRNALCLYADPNGFDMVGADCNWWLLTDKITEKEFKRRYPNAEPCNFEETEFDDDDQWRDEDEKKVRICEYWWREPVKKTISLLNDGTTIDETELKEAKARGLQIIKQREVNGWQIKAAIYSGDAELTKPADYPGKYFPFVRVYGDYILVDGRIQWSGLTTQIKDSQRVFNVMMTSACETVANASQSKVWATAEQANGLASHWAEAHAKNLPYQVYNHDSDAPGPPVRIGGADVPVAMIQMAQLNADEIKADSGIFDSSLGNHSNETSGKAITARQRQGEIATFNYPDNMAKGVKRTWDIMIDMIPRIYDTQRIMRILGADGSEKYVKLYEPDAQGNVLNDLGKGKYDTTITVGPSFSTQRQEAVEAYTQIAQTNPAFTGIAGDLMMKAMDLPYSEQIAERMKLLLPPQVQAQINQDKPLPPEVQQAMAQANQAMQQVEEHGKLVQAAAQELEQSKAEDTKRKAELQVLLKDIDVKSALFEAGVAKDLAAIVEKQAALDIAMAQATTQQETEGLEMQRSELQNQVAEALAAINAHAAQFSNEAQQFLGHASQAINEVHGQVQETARPKRKSFTAKRENGGLVGQIQNEDGTTREIRMTRNNGQLEGTIH